MVGSGEFPLVLTIGLSLWLLQEGTLPPASADAQNPVAVKETAPVRMAFVEHVGPYWSAGAVFARVRDRMVEMGESGPLFVDYPLDPGSSPAGSLRSRVGFVVQGAREPGEPFRMDRQPGRLVAYLLVPGPFGTTSRHYAALHSWARANDYEPTGHLIEFYWPAAKPFDREVVEIQLDVRRTGKSNRTAGKMNVESLHPRAEGQPEPSPASQTPQAPSLEERAPESSPELGDVDPLSSEPIIPEPDPREVASPQNGTLNREWTFEELYVAGRYDLIAMLMMPDDLELAPEVATWLDHFMLRLAALGRWVERKDVSESTRLRALIGPVLARHSDVAAEADATSGPAVSSIRAKWRDPEATGVMRDFDRLLGRAAISGADLSEIEGECIVLVTRAAAVLRRPADK